MTTQPPNPDLPETLLSIRTRPLFVMRIAVSALHPVGGPPGSPHRVGIVSGGTFTGERLSGEVMDGGNDWQTIRGDGSVTLDVRLVLKTAEGALIGMTYSGMRHGPPEIMEQIARGEIVDPAGYYFRITPTFTTSAPRFEWLNRILAVGIGHRIPSGPVYSVFELL